MTFLDSLNSEQREAVTHFTGPLLVSAGPGTGKTQTLAARVATLIIEHQIPPEKILAVTFTNRAANEMRRRVGTMVAAPSAITTLHAFAYGVLSDVRGAIRVADGATQKGVLEATLKEMNVKISSREFPAIFQALSRLKNQPALDFEWPVIEGIFSVKDLLDQYQEQLRQRGVCDFDDLIRDLYFSLREQADLRTRLQDRFQFILVDEFQDMTPLQGALIDLLAASHRNLWVIGDPDQAIYSWRGSSPRLMIDFDRRYPDATIVILKQNYRNPDPILKPAIRLIEHNQDRLPRAAQPVAFEGVKVRLWTLEDEVTGRWAIQQILESFFGSTTSMAAADAIEGERQTHELHFEDVAILFRKQKEGEILRSFLEEKGFPVHLSCEKDIHQSKPISEFFTLARLLLQPEDGERLYQLLLAVPGFPEVYADEWAAQARLQHQLLHRVIVDKSDSGEMPPGVREFWTKIVRFLEAAEEKMTGSFQSFWSFLESDFWPFLNLRPRERHRLESFLPTAQLYFFESASSALRQLIAQAETAHEAEPEIAAQKIQLLTLHAAKGLEFKRVILVGLEEGNLPVRKAETVEQIEEERRLLYVGMTRAVSELHLITLKKREGKPCSPSRFLDEIPREFLADQGFSERYRKRQKNRQKKQMQPTLF